MNFKSLKVLILFLLSSYEGIKLNVSLGMNCEFFCVIPMDIGGQSLGFNLVA